MKMLYIFFVLPTNYHDLRIAFLDPAK